MKPSGVLVLDKAAGATSHDIVQQARRRLQTREIGHAGTLDPMATGVLVLAIGEATKLVPYLTAAEKSYEATVRLGVTTRTLDADSEVSESVAVPDDWRERLPLALTIERARTEQIPPIFSAIRQEGVRAHVLARRGETVTFAPRAVRVLRLDVTFASDDAKCVALSLDVSKGYYVRSLARDLAASLGTVAHLTSLRRTQSGCFSLSEACLVTEPDLAGRILPLGLAAARALPSARLTPRGCEDARNGRSVAREDFIVTARGISAWLDEEAHLIAVGEIVAEGGGRVIRGFR